MAVKLGTLNCRGGKSKIPHIIELSRKYKIDVLSLQEMHKLKPSQVNELQSKTGMKCFSSFGTDGARGVITLVRESDNVRDPLLHSCDTQGNSVVIVVNLGGNKFKVQNIYAPNMYGERTRFLTKQMENMDNDNNIICAGDFNCIENFDLDSIGKSYKHFASQKSDRDVLHQMNENYGYIDSFRTLYPDSKQFTFTGVGSYRARLDRIYIHESNVKLIRSAAVHPVSFSDHDLYMTELEIQSTSDRVIWGRGLWKLNASLLDKPHVLQDIKRLWKDWREQKHLLSDQITWWEFGKQFLKSELIKIGRNEKKLRNQHKAKLEDDLRGAVRGTGPHSADRIRTLKAELAELEEAEIMGAAVRSRTEWNKHGEKGTRYFFNLEKINGQKKCIKELEIDGKIITGKEQILQAVQSHFEDHFAERTIDETACNQLVSTITKRLTDDDNYLLEQPFTMAELEAVHRLLPSGKAPGNDGISVEFYKNTWNFIKHDLLDTLNEVFISKDLSISMTQSVVTLIYKNKGSPLHLKNYRAISLLNVDFKYLSSMINARIKPVLGKVIEVDQGGGVEGRLIEDQLIMIQNIYDHYKGKPDGAMIVAEDLASAFDFLSHKYLYKVLTAMNFSHHIINLLRSVYSHMYAAVNVNGAKTKYFQLKKSIRQGAPWAVTWFVIGMEPLGNMIRSSRKLHPIVIPNQRPKIVNMFVDDTSVFSADPRDHKVIKNITKIYEAGTGARFNPTKSEILLLGRWSEADKTRLPQSNIKSDIKLLGVWFGPNADKLNQESIVAKIKETTNFWKTISLSFQGKKLIIETKIISKLVHVARITGIPKPLQKEVRKLINEFFWHPRKMTLIAMSTLQNQIRDGGLGLPDLQVLHKAILLERVSKAVRSKKPWVGQLIYRNGYTLRELNRRFTSKEFAHTNKQTMVSGMIASAYNEVKSRVSDWAKEDLKSLQTKLRMKSEFKLRAARDFTDTWNQISKSTTHRKCRDLCYLIAHDSLTLNATLKRRHVTSIDTCTLCGNEPETIQHIFIRCVKVQKLKSMLERWIEPISARTLSEEQILYHEGRSKMKKKENHWIAMYKHTIWTSRAKLYHGEINQSGLVDDMTYTLKRHKS